MELLKNLVSIETPSADREANERIAAHLDTYCDALGMEREIHHFEKAGPTFAAWTRAQEKKPDSSARTYGYGSRGWKIWAGTVSCKG